jgi:hypothetical protein
MRTFWITFFSGLLFIAGFNYWVDPAHRWHRTNLSFMKNWSPDSCWLTPKEMDTFQFKLRHIDLIQRPDLLFLGSSRVMGASTEMLGPGVTSYNGGIHSAGAEEYVVVWEKMLRAKGAPRFLIIFVDPWVFNQSRLNTQWLPGLSLYFSFLRRVEDSKSGLSSLWLLRHSVPELSKHYWAEFAELFSWETFKTSVALLYDGKISEGTSLVSRNYEIPPDKSCYSSDGSRRIHEPSETEETLRKAATKQYATGDVPAIAHWKFNPAALDLFTKLLSDAQRAGTKT